jgi:hypothetical protein
VVRQRKDIVGTSTSERTDTGTCNEYCTGGEDEESGRDAASAFWDVRADVLRLDKVSAVRVGLIDRSHLGPISVSVVVPKRAR